MWLLDNTKKFQAFYLWEKSKFYHIQPWNLISPSDFLTVPLSIMVENATFIFNYSILVWNLLVSKKFCVCAEHLWLLSEYLLWLFIKGTMHETPVIVGKTCEGKVRYGNVSEWDGPVSTPVTLWGKAKQLKKSHIFLLFPILDSQTIKEKGSWWFINPLKERLLSPSDMLVNRLAPRAPRTTWYYIIL